MVRRTDAFHYKNALDIALLALQTTRKLCVVNQIPRRESFLIGHRRTARQPPHPGAACWSIVDKCPHPPPLWSLFWWLVASSQPNWLLYSPVLGHIIFRVTHRGIRYLRDSNCPSVPTPSPWTRLLLGFNTHQWVFGYSPAQWIYIRIFIHVRALSIIYLWQLLVVLCFIVVPEVICVLCVL